VVLLPVSIAKSEIHKVREMLNRQAAWRMFTNHFGGKGTSISHSGGDFF